MSGPRKLDAAPNQQQGYSNIQQNYPKCDNIGQTIDTILENVKILSNPQLSHEFSSQFSKLRSNYNLLNDQVQDLRRYKLSEHQDKLLTNIDVTIGKALHVCSTIGNIQQTDNFEYLWANLDGLKSEFDSSVDQFGIQTNRPNERSRTNSNERQSTANIPPPQNQSVLNINQFKLTVCDINSLFQQITLLPKSQEWETSSTLKEIFYKFETLVSIYDNTQWHTASLGPQYCTVFKTFLTDMNNFLNKLESKRSVHEKYTKVKKNEFNTIIETLDKSIKKLMPTEHGLHRPPEYQVPSASSSNSGYFPSFSFNSLNFVSGIYNNWRDNSGSNKKAQEDSAELARWEEENRRFEKQKNEAREKRKREEEQEERQFKESLKLLDESRREKERKLQELLLRQKEEAEEEALRRLANDSEIEQKLEKIRYENEQQARQKDNEQRLMRKQYKIHHENAKLVKTLENNIKNLLMQITNENAKEAFSSFHLIVESFYSIQTSLGRIKAECILPNDEIPQVDPGVLNPEFDQILFETTLFDQRHKSFHQVIVSNNHTDPNFYEVCASYIRQMDTLVSSPDLKLVCAHLPRAIDDGIPSKVNTYGKLLDGLSNEFLQLRHSLTNGVHHLVAKYISNSAAHKSIK